MARAERKRRGMGDEGRVEKGKSLGWHWGTVGDRSQTFLVMQIWSGLNKAFLLEVEK